MNIKAMIEWLNSADNELLVKADNDAQLECVALCLASAAEALEDATHIITQDHEVADTSITPQFLDEMAAVAEAFAESDDELLQKQAAILDNILLTLSDDRLINAKTAEEKFDAIKKKYQEPRDEIHERDGVKEAVDAIEKSHYSQQYRLRDLPLSNRYCPDHAGTMVGRLDQGVIFCPLDYRRYDFTEGGSHELLDGTKVDNGSISEQGKFHQYDDAPSLFDTRETRTRGY